MQRNLVRRTGFHASDRPSHGPTPPERRGRGDGQRSPPSPWP